MSVPYAKSSGSARAGKPRERLQRASGVDGEVPHLHVAHAAGAIHHERDAAFEVPQIVPGAVLPTDGAGGIVVAQEPEGEPELARPREIAGGRIGGDSDDLRVQRGILGGVIPEPGEFALSPTREGLDVEGDHHELTRLQKIGEAQRVSALIDERERRRGVADGEWRRALCGTRGDGHAVEDDGGAAEEKDDASE